jgi:predicted RND superfamily exporter protein
VPSRIEAHDQHAARWERWDNDANTLRAGGYSKIQAIRESASTRFRPIMMTTIAMIAGMIPLAIAVEPGSQIRQSLGIVVIGGLISSLLLTLLLIPIMYEWIAPREFRKPRHIAVRTQNHVPTEIEAEPAVPAPRPSLH